MRTTTESAPRSRDFVMPRWARQWPLTPHELGLALFVLALLLVTALVAVQAIPAVIGGIYSQTLIVHGRARSVAIVAVSAAALNILLNLLLIPPLGLIVGWESLYGPAGYLTQLWSRNLHLPAWNLTSLPGMSVLGAVVTLPIAYLTCKAVLDGGDGTLEDAVRKMTSLNAA